MAFTLQVELVLDVEAMLPLTLRRRFTLRSRSVKPNTKANPILKFFSSTDSHIVEKLNPEQGEFQRITNTQEALANQVNGIKQRMKNMRVQNERMESMLSAIMTQLKVLLCYNVTADILFYRVIESFFAADRL